VKPQLKTQTTKGKSMEFLKEILGEELYSQLVEKINAHNGNEANKDNQIKIGNLGKGEYVAQGKYKALEDLLKGKETELTTANELIAELKKGTKGNEEMQGKITAYESQVAELQQELAETKVKSAIKVGLAKEGVIDADVVEFLTEKLLRSAKEKGAEIKVDENDNIKGWDDHLTGLKTQSPKFFEGNSQGGMQVLGDNKLPKGEQGAATVTKEQFRAMSYEERVALKQTNEQLYKNLANN